MPARRPWNRIRPTRESLLEAVANMSAHGWQYHNFETRMFEQDAIGHEIDLVKRRLERASKRKAKRKAVRRGR